MAREYVPIFFDWMEVTGELNAQEKGRLIDAIVQYARGGDWQDQIKGNERYLFPAFRRQIDRSMEVSASKSDAATVREEQKKAQKAQESTKSTKSTEAQKNPEEEKEEEENKKEDKDEKEKDGKEPHPCGCGKKTTRRAADFRPPSFAEVKAFCDERKSSVDPKRFWAYYQSTGWRIGRKRITDWKAAVIAWENDKSGSYTAAGRNGERQYTEEELARLAGDPIIEALEAAGSQEAI